MVMLQLNGIRGGATLASPQPQERMKEREMTVQSPFYPCDSPQIGIIADGHKFCANCGFEYVEIRYPDHSELIHLLYSIDEWRQEHGNPNR